MPEGELSAARARIETVDRRLAALQDLGIDIASLRTQLAVARARVDEGSHGDAQAVVDEVADAARRLASGATARGSDWRGLPRERVIEELRQIVADGGAGEAVTALREHVDTRLRDFERRLRDQFARELAQVIAARPWAKDLTPAGAGAEPVDAAELAALRAQVEQLRAEVEALARSARDSDPERLRAMIAEALAARAEPAPAGGATDDLLRGLVVQAGAIQDRLSERLLGLEQRIGGLLDRLATPPGPAAPLTGLTALHIDVDAGSGTLPLPPSAATANPAPSPAVETIPAAIHLPDPHDPSGSDWIFPGEDSGGGAVPGDVTVAVPAEPAAPLVAIEQKLREALPGTDANEAKTAAFPLIQEAVTAPVVHDDRPPALGADEALVQRLLEKRLASWRPSSGEELVSDEAEQGRQLVRLLPAALRDPAVRTELFAALALEATAHSGVLAELTGLRAFLRRELRLAVDEIKRELGAVGV